MNMKVASLIVACFCVVNAGKVRRQADGEFWWLQNNTAPAVDNPAAPVAVDDTRNYNPDPVPNPNLDETYIDPNTATCECVPYYLCKDGSIIDDGAGLIDIRVLDRSTPKCEGFLDVCCNAPYGPTDPVVTVRPPTGYQPTCGKRNEAGTHVRITGDAYAPTNSQFGEFPWMTAVLRKETIGDKVLNLYICGGSLIKPNVVLTAAHCVSKYIGYADGLLVRLGEWNTQDTNEPYDHQDINVASIEIHPKFHPSTLYNDFALLFLEYDATLTSHVDTVCLPPAYVDLTNQRCFATGWGKDEFGKEGSYQNILKLIDLPYVNNEHCQAKLRETRLGQYFRLHDTFMCAGGEPEKDACKGDGGSPLVCPIFKDEYGGPIYAQVGIVAWGIGCGENGVPGVYASVSAGLEWIESTAAGGVGPYSK